MSITPHVKKIIDNYESDNAGTGKLVILPVDQGFEHGPVRSFGPNPAAYDPHYDFSLAIEAGLNAYAAERGANGSIIGRNTFQRPRAEALELLSTIISIFKDAA